MGKSCMAAPVQHKHHSGTFFASLWQAKVALLKGLCSLQCQQSLAI